MPANATIYGAEFAEIPIIGLSAVVADTDDSNGGETLSVVIRNVPLGSVFTSNVTGVFNTGAGAWSMPPEALPGLVYKPPIYYGGTIELNLTAIVFESSNGDRADNWATFVVDVEPVASPFLILAKDVSLGNSGSAATDFSLRLLDTRGTEPGEVPEEQVTLTFTDVPSGIYFLPEQGGNLVQNGTDWVFKGTQDQASSITLYTGPGYPSNGNYDIKISAFTSDGDDKQNETTEDKFRVYFSKPDIDGSEVSPFGGGNDVLRGSAGVDVLNGLGGIDFLHGGGGADQLEGSGGTDIFFWETADIGDPDTIINFDKAAVSSGGDILDLSQLMVGYNPQISDIADFVKLVEVSGSHTSVLVEINGDNIDVNGIALVTLDGETGLDLYQMLANGNILI